MKLVSKILLYVARQIPVGYWRIIRFTASIDQTLWDLPLPLKCCPGLSLRADLREPVYTGVFRTGAIPHQIGFDRVCKRLLRKDDIVFDVGANVGYTSMYFSTLVYDGLVVSLEPVPRSFALLQRTCEGRPNIKCLNVAASRTYGKLNIFPSDMLDRATVICEPSSDTVSVRAVTLDSLVTNYGYPRFVKIDVEGFEEHVIEGMQSIFRHKNNPIIIFEALNDSCRLKSRTIIEHHANDDYSFYRIGTSGELLSFDDESGSSDYLALPEWGTARLDNS